MLGYGLRGLVLGFSIAAPVGPTGVLCIQRTLARGWRIGFVSGLGAATADATYGAIAAFGLRAVSALLVSQAGWIRLVGGFFLLALGARILAAPTSTSTRTSAKSAATTILGAYTTALALTLANPATILSFIAIFAGLGLAGTPASGSGGVAAALVLGVFSGSALWWLILTGAVARVRGHVDVRALRWISRVSGTTIMLFALVAFGSLIQR